MENWRGSGENRKYEKKGKEKMGKREKGIEVPRVEKGNPVLRLATKRGYLGQTNRERNTLLFLLSGYYSLFSFGKAQHFIRPILH